VQTVSEYVQRGALPSTTHFHVDTTWSDDGEYVTLDLSAAIAALESFAQKVTRAYSYAKWPTPVNVTVLHGDDLPDYGRIYPCDDPSCECSLHDADSYLADTDPLDDIRAPLSAIDYAESINYRS